MKKSNLIDKLTIDFDALNKEPDKRIYDFLTHIIERAGYNFYHICDDYDDDYWYAIECKEIANTPEEVEKFAKDIETVTDLKFNKVQDGSDCTENYISEDEHFHITMISIGDPDFGSECLYLAYCKNLGDFYYHNRPYLSSTFGINNKDEFYQEHSK